MPKWWIETTSVCAQLVSISTDGPISNWYTMELPNAKVLVLNIQAQNDTLPHFMEKLDNLKVLIITNSDLCSAEISNFSLLGHLQNLRRVRLEHIAINSVASSILQLKNLRKLSLIMCKIDDACKGCTIQVPDMPNLVEIIIDYCIDLEELPMWLCNIKSLEKISITNCHDLIGLPEEFENLFRIKLGDQRESFNQGESGSLQPRKNRGNVAGKIYRALKHYLWRNKPEAFTQFFTLIITLSFSSYKMKHKISYIPNGNLTLFFQVSKLDFSQTSTLSTLSKSFLE